MHADSLEVWQAVASAAAAAILMWALYDATRDALVVAGNPDLSPIAIGNVLRSSARLAKSLLFAFAGFACLFLPPPPPDEGPSASAMLVMRISIMGATGIILLDSVIERYVRQKFISSISKRRRAGDAPAIPQEETAQ